MQMATQRRLQPDFNIHEQRNTSVCSIDTSPRISTIEIHEWIQTQLQVAEQNRTELMIQIDETRLVFIKFTESTYMQDILMRTNGKKEYKHVSGVISTVRIEVAGMGTRRVRVANLPPEISAGIIRAALRPYGEVQAIQGQWSSKYRYPVANGIKIATMQLKNIQSYIIIAGYRALTSYEGQPQTCFACGDTVHVPRLSQTPRRHKPNQNPYRHHLGTNSECQSPHTTPRIIHPKRWI